MPTANSMTTTTTMTSLRSGDLPYAGRVAEIDEAHRRRAVRRLYFNATVAKHRRAAAAPGHQRNDVHVMVASRREKGTVMVKPSPLGVIFVYEPSYGRPIPLRVCRKALPFQQTPTHGEVVERYVIVDGAASCEPRRRGRRDTRDVAADAPYRRHGTDV